MNASAWIIIGAALAVALIDWWAVHTGAVGVEYLAKPVVIVLLVGLALAIDADDGVTQGIVVAALGASLIGDVVLMVPDGPFEGGLAAFLVAHVLYIIALAPSVEVGPAMAGAIIVIGLGFGVAPRLLDAVRERSPALVIPVLTYIVAVSVTAVTAVGTGVLVAAIGGLLFLASDAMLGWGRFVGPVVGGRTAVHATYHLGQLGLVSWLAV